MKKSPRLIAAGACFLLSAFFKFALIGYGVMALCFLCLGALIILYTLFAHIGAKRARNVLTALLCLGLALFIAVEIPIIAESRGDRDVNADYIIVLGAGVNGSTPSLSMVNRLSAALEYLSAHPDCKAVLSGGQGQGEDISEARAMLNWLLAKGIEENRLIMEDKSTSTAENLAFSYKFIPSGSVVAVVSSEYHLCRAKYIASLMGYEVGGIPGRTTYPVLRLNYFIREAFGMVYVRVFGI